MPLKVEAIEQYLNSSKFKKLKEWYSHDFTQYAPFIVQHKKKNKLLHCNLTKMTLNKIPEEVIKHMNGKKFKR